LPLDFWDERLTTVAAERTLLEADVSRRRRREVIDKVAATVDPPGIPRAEVVIRSLRRCSALAVTASAIGFSSSSGNRGRHGSRPRS
jgi:hypothetical protein